MARKPDRPLRKGWTTGACATAAARAAYGALLTGKFSDPVTITLPRGETPRFALARKRLADGFAEAAIVKDAGDDPDVTHGAVIQARVELGKAGGGVEFRAGPGVGTATLPGLPIAVGEPAINPAPRAMMRAVIGEIAAENDAPGDVIITLSVDGGEALAEKTWNPRLGIVGGLSILGTTGIVVPYSCSAWIHSIHSGIDVARASGFDHVAGSTGKTSEAAVKAHYHLPDPALLDMGDFAGGLLKYLRRNPLPRLTIAGGFAKLTKLAQGHLDLHSSRSQVDFDDLAAMVHGLGASADLIGETRGANTANQVLELARQAGLPLADLVARRARETALATLAGETRCDVLVIARDGGIIGRADG